MCLVSPGSERDFTGNIHFSAEGKRQIYLSCVGFASRRSTLGWRMQMKINLTFSLFRSVRDRASASGGGWQCWLWPITINRTTIEISLSANQLCWMLTRHNEETKVPSYLLSFRDCHSRSCGRTFSFSFLRFFLCPLFSFASLILFILSSIICFLHYLVLLDRKRIDSLSWGRNLSILILIKVQSGSSLTLSLRKQNDYLIPILLLRTDVHIKPVFKHKGEAERGRRLITKGGSQVDLLLIKMGLSLLMASVSALENYKAPRKRMNW